MGQTTTHLWAVIQEWLDQIPYPPSQARLSKKLGLKSRSGVTDWKFGKTRPTPAHLEALAEEMAPVAGPDIYDRLLEAVNRDQGYRPRRRRSA